MSLVVPSKMARPSRVPGATYRLQLQPSFGFRAAASIVPWLSRLGVTDCYVSPITTPRPGSTHGYDVCDYDRLNPELGSEADYDAFIATLRSHRMGLIVDIVPNHMAADETGNRWWRDVLRHGRGSDYARFFDIDWDTLAGARVLLPVLENPYGDELANGRITLSRADDDAAVLYGDRRFPIAPGTLPPAGDNLDPGGAAAVDAVLDRQHYRLAWWRLADDEINYRRFFAVNDLVALSMDDGPVFDAVHRLIRRLVGRGDVTGLRVDHPDGLADPERYFETLQSLQPPDGGVLYVVAEKILIGAERTRDSWAMHGTTGYDFLSALNGLFLGAAEARALERVQAWFIGASTHIRDVMHRAKLTVMETSFAGAIDRLTGQLAAAASRDLRTRDLSRRSLRRALVQLIAALDVYRTYVTDRGVAPADRERIEAALARAGERLGAGHSAALAFVGSMYLMPGRDPEQTAFVIRSQQVMAAVFAKAVEDMAFYRDATLVSMNEVGANRAAPGTPARRFHAFVRRRHATDPFAMSATSTHDTKLSEDARARLNAVGGCVAEWRELLGGWRAANDRHRIRLGNRAAPTRADEYRFYQALLALWPCQTAAPDAAQLVPVVDRVVDYLVKSAREASRSTSWTAADIEYEQALGSFVRRVLALDNGGAFLDSFTPFARRMARIGVLHSLAQVVIKIGAPGVPDFYQGTERWALTLVDPDNRRVPDYAAAAARLDAIDRQPCDPAALRDLLDRWHDGGIKLFVTAAALRHRRAHPALYADGRYLPIRAASRAGAPRVLAFARRLREQAIVVVAPFRWGGELSDGAWPVGEFWAGASLRLPAGLRGRRLKNVLNGHAALPHGPRADRVALAEVLNECPVAICEAG